MAGISCSSYCPALLREETAKRKPQSEEEIAQAKIAGGKNDPFAVELAVRLAIADLSATLGLTFERCYKTYGRDMNEIGLLWIVLATICLEDKIFGNELPGSIVNHPILTTVPELRNIRRLRQGKDITHLARRFQAAFDTMSAFQPDRPQAVGIASFDRNLGSIVEAEDLWVVLAGLKLILPLRSSQRL